MLIPTFVLKKTIELLAGRFKDAFITPIVKKAGSGPTEAVLTGPSLIFQFYQSSWNDSLLAS